MQSSESNKTNEEQDWYVVYTKPRAEKKVENRLKQKNVEALCPTYTAIRTWSDRKKKVEVPLLNSYLFIKIHNKQDMQLIFEDAGVVRFVKWQGREIRVKQREIDAMVAFVSLVATDKEHQLGETITIEEGNFKGRSGQVIAKTKNKITLFLESLNMKVVLSTKRAKPESKSPA
jgi:transcriptional antiterminator RfaH